MGERKRSFLDKPISALLKRIQITMFPEDAAQTARIAKEKASFENEDECSACVSLAASGLTYDAIFSDETHELNITARSLNVMRELKFGTLYRCDVCQSRWYYHTPERGRIKRVIAREIPEILRWDKTSTTLSGAQVKVLDRIGATANANPTGLGPYADFPCRVITTNGEEIKAALVCRQKYAPDSTSNTYRYASDIAEIFESPIALPLDIRNQTTKAREVRNGLAMTFIESQGQVFFLRWTCNFFEKEGHVTKDVKLIVPDRDFEEYPQLSYEPDDVVYFIAD